MPQRDADLDGFLRSLALAWRAGEVRPTHQPRKRPPRHWRTRQDPFETTWPRVVEWLEAEPHRTAKELFDRLRREHPGMFLPGQLRTLQRRVKDWRRLAARRLVFADPIGASQGPAASPSPDADPNDLASDSAPSILIRGGRDRVAAGRPACQRAARVLHWATALRVTRRPSRGSDGSYGPCGPAWTWASRPSATPTGRGKPPDSGWRAGREPVGVGVKRR